ncbi:MAG: DNA polymerase III subunit delta' [Candidatus Omnitrophica bacterium]|nr:DNA polymerase III subunit delta' [Candidatus Omnitrophota bacterium]
MSFKDITGQDAVIGLLKDCIRLRRLKGSYLFTGPEGVGKKLTAKTLAKAINCVQEGDDSCDRCPSCLKIENNQHPDVHIIDFQALSDSVPEDNKGDAGPTDAVKIGQIRQLQRDFALRPYEGRQKVFVIDQAHNLTASAANALLKILEEPPSDNLIILVTDKPALLFKTIISRCKTMRFPALGRARMEELLKKDFGMDDQRAHFLAYFSEGRAGWGSRLKDGDILQDKNAILDSFLSSCQGDLQAIRAEDRQELRYSLNLLASWFRDIYLLKAGLPGAEVINLDRRDDLLKATGRFTFLELDRILEAVSKSILYSRQNINTRLLLYNLGIEIWKD